jgi:hypothetical protein
MKNGTFVVILTFLAVCLSANSWAADMIELTALSSMERIGQDQSIRGLRGTLCPADSAVWVFR